MSALFTPVGARRSVHVVATTLFTIVVASGPSLAQCSSPDVGRWVNVKAGDDPDQIEIYFAECGDTQQTETRLGVKVFVKQSSGALYQRPPVTARRIVDNGTQWIFAKVPTGGYVDHIYMRRISRGNEIFLKVFIRSESLDSKPSATSWHEYRRR